MKFVTAFAVIVLFTGEASGTLVRWTASGSQTGHITPSGLDGGCQHHASNTSMIELGGSTVFGWEGTDNNGIGWMNYDGQTYERSVFVGSSRFGFDDRVFNDIKTPVPSSFPGGTEIGVFWETGLIWQERTFATLAHQDGRDRFCSVEFEFLQEDLVFERTERIGDQNFDGLLNSTDLVAYFQAGKYEKDVDATWQTGDWTGDERFDSTDLVAMLQQGSYTDAAVTQVPEPSSGLLLLGMFVIGNGRISKERRTAQATAGIIRRWTK